MIIILKKDTLLVNTKNNGLSPLDTRWNKKESITLEAGTAVTYTKEVFSKTVAHTITYTDKDGIKFAKCLIKTRDL